MPGSILKNFKNDLQKHDLLRNQQVKKKHRGAKAEKDKRENGRKVLDTIRQAFNPFDVKQTRDKLGVLGRSVTGQIGKPGISKQRGEDERKRTYEAEKRIKSKVGGVVDRRFGENDKSMSAEDRMVARYAREKLSKTSKKSLFSLDEEDNETLTHFGQALSMNDDFAEDDIGVSDGENGSSDLKRSLSIADEEGNDPHRKKTKHEVMKEVIAKSKMHKAARQQAKEEDLVLIDELNSAETLANLMDDLDSVEKVKAKLPLAAADADTQYDLNIMDMADERRAKPQDRTKTEEELAKEAAEKQKEQLKSRQRRMEDDEQGYAGEDIKDDAGLFGLEGDSAEGEELSESEDSDRESSSGGEADSQTSPSPKVSTAETAKTDQTEKGTAPPQTYKALLEALKGKDDISEIERLVKTLDPSLREGNKERLGVLLTHVAHYASTASSAAQFNALSKLLHSHSETFAEQLGVYYRKAIDSIHKNVVANNAMRTGDLLTFTMIGTLFSTSDQWNLVANGATLVIAQHLSQSVIVDATTLPTNLYLCDILLFYQRFSRRYIPEVAGFLLRTFAAVGAAPSAGRLVRKPESKLKLGKSFLDVKPETLRISKFGDYSIDQLVLQTVAVLDRAATLWKGADAFVEILHPLHEALTSLPANPTVSVSRDRLGKTLAWAIKEKRPLRLQEAKPVGIITHAPLFEESYNPDVKDYDMEADRRELKKLKSQFKKERKQTIKEIRRDAEFVGRERLRETTEKARAAHESEARLINQINNEEGAERNRYERERSARKRRR